MKGQLQAKRFTRFNLNYIKGLLDFSRHEISLVTGISSEHEPLRYNLTLIELINNSDMWILQPSLRITLKQVHVLSKDIFYVLMSRKYRKVRDFNDALRHIQGN